ncbi:MAG TPA: trypsin-like peptidase domain-containing protein [Clostridia bacterium]|nr:trypsin-like peptidase domain-containing protein [Clostridia bacterium]
MHIINLPMEDEDMDDLDDRTKEQQEEAEQAEQEIHKVLVEEENNSTAQNIMNTIDTAPVTDRNEYRSYKRPSGLSYLATALVGAIIGGLIVAVIVPSYLYNRLAPMLQGDGNVQMGQQVVIKPSAELNVAAAVAQKVTPSVVRISTVTVERDLFFGKRSYEGVGSGVVIDPKGYIITNAHVVGEHPEELTVFFKDGKELDGKVLWKDSLLDLAVVKVEAAGLPAAELGDSDNLIVGETSIAIGNPLGMRFERTVTQGIVSGLNRSIMVEQGSVMEDLIQTDAAINPGNSGGPLINGQGQVIGINTVKASAEGLGFAIPINITKPITQKLIKNGEFIPTYMGITPLDSEMLGYYATDIEIKKGIYVYDIMEGAPAARAGLRTGDVITHINDAEVNTLVKFKSILYSMNPDDTISVRYIKNNTEYTADIKLAEMPEEYR